MSRPPPNAKPSVKPTTTIVDACSPIFSNFLPIQYTIVFNFLYFTKVQFDTSSDKIAFINCDIEKIKQTFLTIFKSIFHSRLDYEEELNKIIDQTKSKFNEE